MDKILFNTTYEQLIPRLLVDVPDEQHGEIETIFKTFLESFFEHGVNNNDFPLERRERIFRESAKRLANEAAEKAASERVQFLHTKLIAQDVAALDNQAFELAQEIFRDPALEQQLALQKQAKTLRQTFEELISRCEQLGIDWKRKFGRTLSEVNLDINYVLGENRKVSMRMGHLFRSRDRVRNHLPSSPPHNPPRK